MVPSGTANLSVSMRVPAMLAQRVCVWVCVCTVGIERGRQRDIRTEGWWRAVRACVCVGVQDESSQSSSVIISGAGARCYCCHVALLWACSVKTWTYSEHSNTWMSFLFFFVFFKWRFEWDSSHSNCLVGQLKGRRRFSIRRGPFTFQGFAVFNQQWFQLSKIKLQPNLDRAVCC